jgi:hypothetical protein
MKKKEEPGASRVELKVASQGIVPNAQPQNFSMEAIFQFAQNLAAFDRPRSTEEAPQILPAVASLDNIQRSTKKSAIRLKSVSETGTGNCNNPDNVESIASEGRRTKPPLSARKGH